MKTSDWLTLALTCLGIILIPLVGLLIRIVIRQARVEDRLASVVQDFRDTTREIQQQIREDRQSTNKRLTWLEQNFWRKDR